MDSSSSKLKVTIRNDIYSAVDQQAKEKNLSKSELVEMILARHFSLQSLADFYLDGTPPCFEVEAGDLHRDSHEKKEINERPKKRFFSYNR